MSETSKALKELGKLKNLVKVQAAVRGHLVRKHAAGTLRCIQAIVKMQVLVRACLSQDGLYSENKLDGKLHNDNQTLGSSAIKQNETCTSIENLLSNKFARQLMDSTPKTKPIHFKCDPLKPNSAWSCDNYETPLTTTAQSEAISESNEPKTDVWEILVSSKSEENPITDNAANFKFEECEQTSSPVTDDMDQPQIDTITSDLKENSQEINTQDQMMQTDAHSQTLDSCLSSKLEIESEQPKHSTKRFASEQLETEPMKIAFGSRKANNPAFIPAQTKFKELNSTANSSRSVDSSPQDIGDESNVGTLSSEADTISRLTKPSITGNAVNNRKVQCSGSECGAEISIISTLGSPDISEVSEQKIFSSNSIKDLNVKENKTVVADSPQVAQQPPKGTPDLHRDLDSEMGNQAYILSPEASPKCHMIVPESQRTPSSEVSVKAKNKKDTSCQKSKSLSAAKSSLPTPAHDSGARCSMEQLPKDQKNGKIRNSLGSGRPDNIDGEPRDSNSSNSLPRFMHATESARAKVNAKTSPRSSPNVQDRDIYIKKRHSLPAANGRQGSPRIQGPISFSRDIYIKKRHSLPAANGRQGSPRIQGPISQSHQGAKGNGTNPMHGEVELIGGHTI
ncbi:putative Zinc finger C-x8-C-x5-C-x3-H type family protein [Hibiscus syriacus]|uniref:Zinc finger C-x8-C-x5-C-x3-H type family protein n=1 Tax=Hibiscus syriacus TaxID=106335 RepID=A0A6A3B738_HIBSY|nr:putative Zinc finger C-x8-C-x5-C-x3-H type family protein [Hibiscus syriacus]